MKMPSYKPEDPTVIRNLWLKEGQEITGVFRGEFHEFQIHWVNKKKVTCQGAGCELCLQGDKSKFQFRVNFVHKDEEGILVASLYENDWFAYNRLGKINMTNPLESSRLKIKKGLDNGFKVDLFVDCVPLQEPTLTAITHVQLHPLADQKADYSGQDKKPEAFNSEDIPF